jgi:hypothetical protein
MKWKENYLPKGELEQPELTKQACSIEILESAQVVLLLASKYNCNYQKKSS